MQTDFQAEWERGLEIKLLLELEHNRSKDKLISNDSRPKGSKKGPNRTSTIYLRGKEEAFQHQVPLNHQLTKKLEKEGVAHEDDYCLHDNFKYVVSYTGIKYKLRPLPLTH